MPDRSQNWTRVAVLLALAGAVTPGFAQQTPGLASIIGVVKDQSGAVIPQAAIVVRSLDPTRSYSAVTDSSGAFRLTDLPRGRYTVSVAMHGFHTSEKIVDLTANSKLEINTTLAVADFGGDRVEAIDKPIPVQTIASPAPVLKQQKSWLRKLWCW